MIFIFLKVYLGDSNRQPQSSRKNIEYTPRPILPSRRERERENERKREREEEQAKERGKEKKREREILCI